MIRDVIDTIGRKGVLLLGRFTEGRMQIPVPQIQLAGSRTKRHRSLTRRCWRYRLTHF
jgi:hypothetical protein